MADGREEMLARIRKALGGGSPAGPGERRIDTLPPRLEGVMEAIAPEDVLPKFEAELVKLAGQAHRASSVAELDGILRIILDQSQAAEVVLTRNPLLQQIGLAEKLRDWGKSAFQWGQNPEGKQDAESAARFRSQCFSAAIGFSGVDFALAESGSLVLSSQTEGCQLASLAPPVHVAFYRRPQVMASLDEVLERMPLATRSEAGAPGRSIVFITGPSRTADIEQILIRGVHGPREVHAILVEDCCLA